jgi:hypothetical protein
MEDVERLPNDRLRDIVKALARNEQSAAARLVRYLAEVDTRRLYLDDGYGSLFSWCVGLLQLSAAAAYNRIELARLGRRFPAVFAALEAGHLTLTAARLLGPYLTVENCDEMLAMARGLTRRELEDALSRLTPANPLPIPPQEATIYLAADRYELRFTIGAETRAKLQRARDLLRHTLPRGEYAAIFDRALTALLAEVERRRFAVTPSPRACRAAPVASRYIPADVRRAVWERDGGQCAFIGRHGQRCPERGFLELHHLAPFAAGGAATVDNISLRCRQHNAYEAEVFFGERLVRRRGRPAPR